MKNKSLSALCAVTILLCGCTNGANPESDISLTEAMATTISPDISSTITEPSTATTEATTTPYELDEIDKIIKYIKKNLISLGCFYDFDKDGCPELLEFLGGTYEGKYSYYIYDLKGENPRLIGELAVDVSSVVGNKFSLYEDKNTGELFYFGEWRTIFFGTNQNDEVSICVYKFKNDTIEVTPVGFYTYRFDSSSDMIWIDSSNFMDKKIESGYYDETTISSLLGIDNYLSQFEKIEEPNLEPQWYSYDDKDLESKVREALEGYGF